MVRNAVRALWAEPRPSHPPPRVWRDWVLVAVVVSGSVLETVLRVDLAWRPVVLMVSVVIALALLWRRTHPLGSVAVAFGTLIAFDVARILAVDVTGLLSIAAVLMLPYSLFRWGAGREAAIGLGLILAWLAITHVADPTAAAETVAGYGFFLFSAALGASIRYHANIRIRDIDQAKLREREQLARELHDTVAHHVSAIAVQAQAGRALAMSHPGRAIATLEVIEEAASRTLEGMRTMVGVLRAGEEPNFAPQPGVIDIARLARRTADWPRIDVQLSGAAQSSASALVRVDARLVQPGLDRSGRGALRATPEEPGPTNGGFRVVRGRVTKVEPWRTLQVSKIATISSRVGLASNASMPSASAVRLLRASKRSTDARSAFSVSWGEKPAQQSSSWARTS